jgi:nucleoside-diphosphate-sugar epimerase
VKALVTGGGGFLGARLVAALRDRGDEVIVVGRRRYPEVEALGATCVPHDLAAEPGPLRAAMDGVEVVFHVAALPPVHAPREAFVATNVRGTEHVLAACKAAGVPRLVYTSTPSVVFAASSETALTEADAHYPASWGSPYAETKAQAEQAVLAAHGDGLVTTALRPRLIYGPGEPHMLPRLLARHQAGRLRIVGDGTNRVSLTYVDNAVDAHLAADAALARGTEHGPGGRAFFVADAEPVALWPWINDFFAGVGAPPLTRRISLPAARAVGAVCEALWGTLPLRGEPPMTRFVAANLSASQFYDLSAITAATGWRPRVSGAEGLRRTVAAFREAL